MYQALLTRKYLLSKIIPLLAALAVGLCVATVLTVWSVMGGFLQSLLAQGPEMDGDIKISWPQAGFPYYHELAADLEADPLIEAAAPVIETLGLLALPDGREREAQVLGIDPASYDRVTRYDESLYWRPVEKPNPRDARREDPRLPGSTWRDQLGLASKLEHGRTLSEPGPAGTRVPAAVLGIQVWAKNIRRPGNYFVLGMTKRFRDDGSWIWDDAFSCDQSITLSVLPRQGLYVDVASRALPIANELYSGNMAYDGTFVFVPLETLQEMLQLGARAVAAPDFNPAELLADDQAPALAGQRPARVTTVLIRAAPGAGIERVRQRVREIYSAFAARHPGEVPPEQDRLITTFEERNAIFIGAVRKEIVLVMFIFSIVSVTAVFLVLAIFWAMISEKTRDIGILRAIGASRLGVAWLWLRYGLAIGVIGALVGGALAALIVRNINAIHEWLGSALGISVWNPDVYYFTEIPADPDIVKFAIVMVSGAMVSLIGALIPAWRAARMDPVRALRFE
ncbi:MAG: ABC transporter permease [Phycisphaerales bacterium JB039]